MDKVALRAVVAKSVGDPTAGPVADVLDQIVDAVDAAINPKPKQEQRVVEVAETRDAKTK